MENQLTKLMVVLVEQRKKLVLTLVKQRQVFVWIMHYNGVSCYLHLNKTKICELDSYNSIICYDFCLWSVSKDLMNDEKSQISLNGTVYDFSVNHS